MTAPAGTLARLLEVQRGYLKYSEGPGKNQNIFAAKCRPPQRNGLAWCATFQCGTSDEAGSPLIHESAGAGELLRAYHDAGKSGKTPRVGALVGFAFPGESGAGRFMRINHVGRVEQVRSDGAIVTIEGNTNFAGSRSGGMVLRKVRRANIALYGYVDYKPMPKPPAPKIPASLRGKKPPAWWTHETHLGMVEQEVASVRKRLKLPPGVTFTAGVASAVAYVQHAHGLPVTGRVDRVTAAAIG